MTVVGASASTTPSSSTRTERDERSASTRTYGSAGGRRPARLPRTTRPAPARQSGRCPPIPAERRRGRRGPPVTCLVTRPQPEAVRDPLRSLLLTLLIDQEAVIDVVQWDVVLRVVGNLPAVLRRRRIEDLVVVQIAAQPPRHRLYPVRHGGHLG